MDDGTLNQFYTSMDDPLSSKKPANKSAKDITQPQESDLTKNVSVSSQGVRQVVKTQEDMPVSFELDITRVCVRNGAVRLPYAAKNLFAEKTDLVVRGVDSRSEYVLSFIPPRILDNLDAFFADSNAKANDKLTLKLHGNRGEIKLEKRQTTRRGRRDALESTPTKHELLTAASKAQDPAPASAETQAPSEQVPVTPPVDLPPIDPPPIDPPPVMPEANFQPRATASAGPFNKLKTVVMRPKNKLEQAPQVLQDRPIPVQSSSVRPNPQQPASPTDKANPVLPDTAPARYRVEPDKSEAASSRPPQTPKAPPPNKAGFDLPAHNAYVKPERYEDLANKALNDSFKRDTPRQGASRQDASGHTLPRRTVPSGFAPVGGDDIPPMPAPADELAPEPLGAPSETLFQELHAHMSRPSTPAIMRVDDVADVLGLKAERVQQALQTLSEEDDASVRAIRQGVFQILRRDMSSL